jgi:ATP-dependent RNA helicase SUPV3L1/SUV3
VLGVFVEQLRLDDAHFQVAELEQMLQLAEALDERAEADAEGALHLCAGAGGHAHRHAAAAFLGWTNAHALTGRAGRPWFLDEVDAHSRLDRMEQALRACTLWLWLDLRFPGIYGHVDEVQALRSLLNDGIERQLGGKRPLAQMRRGGRPGGGGGRPRA